MRKYLFITTTLANGGAERVVSLLASSIAELGHEACILKYYSIDNEYPVSSKVSVINLSGGGHAEYQKISYLTKVRKIRKIIKEQKPDFVIPFLFQVALCTEFAAFGLKTHVLQTMRIDPALPLDFKPFRILRDMLVYKSKCTFVQNQAQKVYFPKRYHNKIHVLFNPVSDELFEVEWMPDENVFTVCGVGRLVKQKNFKLLIDAFQKAFADTPNAVLRIYGEGIRAEELSAYANSTGMGTQIQLMGRSNNIKEVYEKTSLFVLSSDYEGMPNALIEAMAVGVPCISTDCPTGPRDLIDHGENGLLVPVGDVDAMVAAMREIYDKKYDLKQMGTKAKEKIWNICCADRIAQKMIDICEGISL